MVQDVDHEVDHDVLVTVVTRWWAGSSSSLPDEDAATSPTIPATTTPTAVTASTAGSREGAEGGGGSLSSVGS